MRFPSTPSPIALSTNGMVSQLEVEVMGNRKKILTDGSLIIGRSPKCDLVVDHQYVSGVHMLFMGTLKHWSVLDQNSTNGIFHAGIRLEPGKPYRLAQTGAFRLGDSLVGPVVRYWVREVLIEDLEPETGSVEAQENTLSFELLAEEETNLPDSRENENGKINFSELSEDEIAEQLLAADQDYLVVSPTNGSNSSVGMD